jgi:hypothetical protein
MTIVTKHRNIFKPTYEKGISDDIQPTPPIKHTIYIK